MTDFSFSFTMPDGVEITVDAKARYGAAFSPSEWTSPKDWKYNQIPFRSDMWRWDAAAQAAHPLNSNYTTALKAISESWVSPQTFNVSQSSDWATPIFTGRPTDPLRDFSDQWTSVKDVHTPTFAKANGSSDGAWTIIDCPTGRSVSPSPWGTAVHDLKNGPGYSANSQDPVIPGEVGGSSSARVESAGMHVRFPNLYRADTSWTDAIQHSLLSMIPAHGLYPGASSAMGTAARNQLAYGQGVRQTADGRLPFVFPAHQGETRPSSLQYAPPSGAWISLNPTVWTQSYINFLAVPNFVKAILWALVKYGTFIVDIQGQKGIQLATFEGTWGYSNAGDPYATNWLASHSDGKFVVGSGGTYVLDITGGNATLRANIINGLRFLRPPLKPADLSS